MDITRRDKLTRHDVRVANIGLAVLCVLVAIGLFALTWYGPDHELAVKFWHAMGIILYFEVQVIGVAIAASSPIWVVGIIARWRSWPQVEKWAIGLTMLVSIVFINAALHR